jgi:NAD(P)-dependent dehydrogenase (short-subunit alcohol dehydrogenase family)
MTWSASDIPDLTGKVAVVTGANGGLGLASAKALAGRVPMS